MALYRFPELNEIHTAASKFSEIGLKFWLRRLCLAKQVGHFEQAVGQSPRLQAFFRQRNAQAYPLLHTFVDKRFNADQRLAAMLADLEYAQQIFAQIVPNFPFSGSLFDYLGSFEKLPLAQIGQWRLCLQRNDLVSNEGFWAISLRDPQDERIYMLTFAFLNEQHWLAASLQGPKGENARETVRLLTKELYGLRPQQLMTVVLQYLAAALGCKRLSAIPQQWQVKYRFRHKQKMTMDYDAFWEENAAVRIPDGYWELPLPPQRKKMSDIPSKKRSQYQKRYAMLDAVEASINSLTAQF